MSIVCIAEEVGSNYGMFTPNCIFAIDELSFILGFLTCVIIIIIFAIIIKWGGHEND